MTEDEKVVQGKETASAEELASRAAETTEEKEKREAAEQPLTKEAKEAIQQMIADATKQAIEEGKQVGRTELQSQQDRNKAEISRSERRARTSESTLGAVRSHLKDDPDVAREFEVAELRAKVLEGTKAEQEEATRQVQEQFHTAFMDSQTEFITNLGIDPKDKRIDWAGDAPNYIEAMKRIQTSVVSIQKESQQAMESGLEKRLKDLEKKSSQETEEANSVETTTSTGVVSATDAEFVKKFGAGDIPVTKQNVERYEKIRNSYE